MRRVLFVALVVLPMVVAGVNVVLAASHATGATGGASPTSDAPADDTTSGDPPAVGVDTNSSSQPEPSSQTVLDAGRVLYAANCAVCHGATGGGIEEARLAFPPDHRHCTRCHKPNNRVVMPLSQMENDHDMFSLGVPPRLHGEGLVSTAPVQTVFDFVRATMPRYEPGRLSDGDYWRIVAFLSDLNQRADATAEAVAAAVSSGE